MFYSFLRAEATEYPKHVKEHPKDMRVIILIFATIAIISPTIPPKETIHDNFINSFMI